MTALDVVQSVFPGSRVVTEQEIVERAVQSALERQSGRQRDLEARLHPSRILRPPEPQQTLRITPVQKAPQTIPCTLCDGLGARDCVGCGGKREVAYREPVRDGEGRV